MCEWASEILSHIQILKDSFKTRRIFCGINICSANWSRSSASPLVDNLPGIFAMLPMLSPRSTAPKIEQGNTTLVSVARVASPPRWPWPALPVSPRATVMAHDVLLSIAEPPAESSIPTRVVLHLWIVPLDFPIKPKQSEKLLSWMAMTKEMSF